MDANERLTEEEAQQYDRQIRLWGLEAQKRLRGARVLVVGMRGLTAEVSKNVVLAGINSLTVLDDRVLSDEDCATRFLCPTVGENRAEAAVPRLQKLNPNVVVSADTENIDDKPDNFFCQFDVICASCCSQATLLRLNKLCRRHQIKFFCGDVWGYYGYCFTDLQEHSYAIQTEKEKSAAITVEEPKAKRMKLNDELEQEEKTTQKLSCSFCSLQDALSVDWSKKSPRYFKRTPATFLIIKTLQRFRDAHKRDPASDSRDTDCSALDKIREDVLSEQNLPQQLINKDFSQYCWSELSPVCAIVGGVLAQEIIKAISANDAPFNNCFMYDGVNSSGIVETLSPPLA